jgi:hypothetical protein
VPPTYPKQPRYLPAFVGDDLTKLADGYSIDLRAHTSEHCFLPTHVTTPTTIESLIASLRRPRTIFIGDAVLPSLEEARDTEEEMLLAAQAEQLKPPDARKSKSRKKKAGTAQNAPDAPKPTKEQKKAAKAAAAAVATAAAAVAAAADDASAAQPPLETHKLKKKTKKTAAAVATAAAAAPPSPPPPPPPPPTSTHTTTHTKTKAPPPPTSHTTTHTKTKAKPKAAAVAAVAAVAAPSTTEAPTPKQKRVKLAGAAGTQARRKRTAPIVPEDLAHWEPQAPPPLPASLLQPSRMLRRTSAMPVRATVAPSLWPFTGGEGDDNDALVFSSHTHTVPPLLLDDDDLDELFNTGF